MCKVIQLQGLIKLEMPPTEQLFDTNLDHLSARNRTHSPPEPNMECGQPAVNGRVGEHAQAHGQYQELCRI